MLAVRRILVALGALVAVGVVTGAVLAFVTYGVGDQTVQEPSSAAPVASAIASSTTSPDVPEAFADRLPFRSCGQVELASGAAIPPTDIACLSATPTEGRELVVVSPSTDGPEIVRYYRTGPAIEGVEIWEDATADPADGAWHHSDCRSGQIDQLGACA